MKNIKTIVIAMALGAMSLTTTGCKELLYNVAAGAASGLVSGLLVVDGYYYHGYNVYSRYYNERYRDYYGRWQYRQVVGYYYISPAGTEQAIREGLHGCSRWR